MDSLVKKYTPDFEPRGADGMTLHTRFPNDLLAQIEAYRKYCAMNDMYVPSTGKIIRFFFALGFETWKAQQGMSTIAH